MKLPSCLHFFLEQLTRRDVVPVHEVTKTKGVISEFHLSRIHSSEGALRAKVTKLSIVVCFFPDRDESSSIADWASKRVVIKVKPFIIYIGDSVSSRINELKVLSRKCPSINTVSVA